MQTEGCSSLEPGVGIEPTSVIPFSLDVYCGLLRAVLLSAARRLNRSAFGGKSLTKAIPTPALRSLAPGNFDASTVALYKASRKFRLARLPFCGFNMGF